MHMAYMLSVQLCAQMSIQLLRLKHVSTRGEQAPSEVLCGSSKQTVPCSQPKAHAVADVAMPGVSELHTVSLKFVGNFVSMQVTSRCFICLGVCLCQGKQLKDLEDEEGYQKFQERK
jgi:hypothetical protein